MNASDFLLEWKDPASPAIEFPEGLHSYGELRALVDRVASAILASDGAVGDRILLLDDNSLFWVAAYLGIMRAGRVVVPLPPDIDGERLERVLRETEARIVFASTRTVDRESARLGHLRVISQIPDTPRSAACPPPREPDARAALMFTSGSTSEPRGVIVTHRNIIANTSSIIQFLGLTEADRMMVVLPFHYCFGTSLLHTHLRVGGTLVVEPRFRYPELVIRRLSESRCTGFAGVPSHFQILLRRSGLASRKYPYLRHVQQAGGHLPASDVTALRQALPGAQIFLMYGQTEATARLSYLHPDALDAKPGSIGRGMPGVELKVVGESGREVAPGEVGEIVARGENIAAGYWRAPKESRAVFREGALYTGDLATIDEEGFIYIVDRSSGFLKVRGERVSCREIENALLEFAELVDAAVVSVPDDLFGESVKAYIVPRHPDSEGIEERLLLFSRRRLPPHLVPREIAVLPELPRNSAGKVRKSTLQALPQGWGVAWQNAQ